MNGEELWPLPEDLRHMPPQYRLGYLAARSEGIVAGLHITPNQQSEFVRRRIVSIANTLIGRAEDYRDKCSITGQSVAHELRIIAHTLKSCAKP